MMYGEPRDCDICGEPGARKVRLDVFPWKRHCVFVCALCLKEVPALLAELRAGLTAA